MKSLLKNLDPIQIIGFVISAAISIGLLITGQNEVASITLGFVLAGLTQLFDMQKRLGESEERLLKANTLSQKFYHDNTLFQHIQRIVEDYQSVKAAKFNLFELRADNAILECRRVIHSMAEGYLTLQRGTAYSYGIEMHIQTEKTAKAVAAIDDTYWRSREAVTYLQENVDAVKRGVRFIRVFTYPSAVLRGMVDIFKHHQSLGIEVYIAPAEVVPNELNGDYIILDDRVVFLTEHAGHQLRILIDKAEVEQIIKQFDGLLRHVKILDDWINDLKEPG